MIFYFSATGNSKYVAERLAEVTGGQIMHIADCISKKEYLFSVPAHEAVGIVTPTYFLGLPSIVHDFLQKLELTAQADTYFYFAATYGTLSGANGTFTNQLLKAKGISLSARFSVKMPDTWTPIFDLSDKDRVAKQNRDVEPQIHFILGKLREQAKGDFMQDKVPVFAAKLYYGIYDSQRATSHFHVEDTCAGCGLCAKKCPVQAIELKSGRPVWVKEKCVMCLGCLHRCPKFSIQYGEKTKNHGQYTNPHVRV